MSGRDGRRCRGREYGWGTVDIENPAHCDFAPLRQLLLATHLQVQHLHLHLQLHTCTLSGHSGKNSHLPLRAVPSTEARLPGRSTSF